MLSLSELVHLFVGKRVRITSTYENVRVRGEEKVQIVEGVCKAIHVAHPFDIELREPRSRFGFVPEVITPDSVEGNLPCVGHRKIQLI